MNIDDNIELVYRSHTDLSDPVTTKHSNNFYNRPGMFTSSAGVQPTSAGETQPQQPAAAASGKCLHTQSSMGGDNAAGGKNVNSANKPFGYVSIDSVCDNNKSIGAKMKMATAMANNNNNTSSSHSHHNNLKDLPAYYVNGEGKPLMEFHFADSHKCSDFEEDEDVDDADDVDDDEDLENRSCSAASGSAPDEFEDDEFRSGHHGHGHGGGGGGGGGDEQDDEAVDSDDDMEIKVEDD